MLPGTVGLCWDGAMGDNPLLGAGEWHSLAGSQPPWVGHRSREESWRYCASGQGQPRAVDTGGDAAGREPAPRANTPAWAAAPATRAGSRLKSLLRSGRPLHLLPSVPPPPLVLGTAPVAPKTSLPAAAPCKGEEERGCSVRGLGFAPRGAQHPSRSEAVCVVWVPGSPGPLGVLIRGKKSPPASWRNYSQGCCVTPSTTGSQPLGPQRCLVFSFRPSSSLTGRMRS